MNIKRQDKDGFTSPINQSADYYYNAYFSKTALTHFFHKHRVDKILSLVPPKSTVLDAGCGSGVIPLLLSEMGHSTTGVDIRKEQIDFAAKICTNGEFHCEDLRKLDLKKCFDVVICSEVIEHFNEKDRNMILDNLDRHVKKGGYLILTFPSKLYPYIEALWEIIRKIKQPGIIFDDEEVHETIELSGIIKNLEYRNYSIEKIDSFVYVVTYILANKKAGSDL